MAKYTDHSKFAYMNYDEIQDGINAGTIGPYDLILCKDTREFKQQKKRNTGSN